MESSRRRVAKRAPIIVLIVAGMSAFAVAAWADLINYTGQGTTNGACNSLVQGSVAADQQIWQFNLTQTEAGATITASFSDGTIVTNQAESQHQGNTSFFFIQTDLGATLTAASATFTPSGPNSQFTVSHCTVASTTTAPTTASTAPTTTTAPNGTTTTAPNGTTTTAPNGTTTTAPNGTTTTAPTGTTAPSSTTPTSGVGGASVTATIALSPTTASAQARRLAFTGSSDVTVVFLWGLGLVLLGTGLAILARRHRVPPTEQ